MMFKLLKQTLANNLEPDASLTKKKKKCRVNVGLTHSHCPVYTQVQRNQDEVVEEKVNGLGPAFHRSVSSHLTAYSPPQLREEEGAERIDF